MNNQFQNDLYLAIRRKTIIIFCILIIFTSGSYSYWYCQKHFFSLKDYLENEDKWHGREIVLNYRRVAKVGPGYFVICEEARDVRGIGEVKKINSGDIVSFKGIFQKGATIKLTSYYVSKYRPLKYAVSILATFLSFLWLFASFRVNWKRLVLVERDTCQTS